jgi:pimeloyl-ACP methyl ester carboxylesterase
MTKTYWAGIDFKYPGFSEEYSWVAHAASQGYTTLAIDNLGNGLSDHPDPLNVVQTPIQIDIIRSIVQGLRFGSFSSISQSYEKVIFAGYSYGSIIGRSLATVHPSDGADAYILTATSNNLTALANPSFFFAGGAASVVDPSTFKHLPPGYRTFPGLRDALYSFSPDFDPRILAHDERQPHVFAMGELLSPEITTASNFTGPVLVLTGRYDQIVCGHANITASAADCGVGKGSNPDMTRVLFPEAKFESYEPDHTGHNTNLHYSAPESFGAAHKWLESAGF